MEYKVENGCIIVDDSNGYNEPKSYPITGVEATYGFDMPNVEGVMRMTELVIESDAPFEINNAVSDSFFNELCEEQFVDEDENWSANASKSIEDNLGVDSSVVNIKIG